MIEEANINKEMCCGCGLCSIVCPTNAIAMIEDAMGINYPIVDNEVCIKCGKCIEKCEFKIQSMVKNRPKLALVGHHIDEKIVLDSASGGAFTAICETLSEYLNYKLTIYGASWITPFVLEHIGIDSLSDIDKLRKSKYIQSISVKCFPIIREKLVRHEYVLFSGTPCQIAALKTFLGNISHKTLYTVEVVCNGVASTGAYRSYIKERFPKAKKVDMRFKKNYHGKIYSKWLRVQNGNKTKLERMNYFLSAYYAGYLNRASCFNCPYANSKRVADITIGDIHVKYEQVKCLNEENGVSMVLFNTDKILNIIDIFKERFCYFEIDVDKAIEDSIRLHQSAKKPTSYEKLLPLIVDKKINSDKAIKSIVTVYPMWKQKMGEFIPTCLWKKFYT